MKLVQEQAAFLIHVGKLIAKANESGFMVTGGELFRTAEQQAMHVKNGRSKTMSSQHLNRLAIDLNFFREKADGSMALEYDVEALRGIGDYWESLYPGNRWGGNWRNFKDTPHFERQPGGTTSPAISAEEIAETTQKKMRALAQRKIIASAVGPRASNQRDDVETIQRLLNLAHSKGRVDIKDPLKPDGIFGGKTLSAIESFQRSVLGTSEPTLVVIPGSETLAALLESLTNDVDSHLISLIYLKASEQDLNEFAPMIKRTLVKRAIDTPIRRCHFLAQIGHESGELRFKEEIAGGEDYEGRGDLGNSEPGDGRKFKGRGLIQLTGRANYAAYGKSIGRERELIDNPEIIAKDPELCVDVAGWFWEKRGLNALADRDDLEAVTRKINGGLNGLADRRRLLERSKNFLAT